MKPVRYETPRLLNDFDNWFSDPFFGFGELSRLFPALAGNGASSREGRLATDLYEDDENYFVRFEVPGVKKEDLKLEVEGGVLTTSFERKQESDDRRESVSFRRAVRLPEGVDPEKIRAKLEDGVLTVTVAKAEARKPRAIEIG